MRVNKVMAHKDEEEPSSSPTTQLGKETQLGDWVPISKLKQLEQVLIPLLEAP